MSLSLADVQTPLPQLFQTEVYAVQELPELRIVDVAAQRALHALLAGGTVSLRAIMLRQHFLGAVDKWREEVGISSLLAEKRASPAYQSIVDMGEDAIPLLLEEIALRPSLIFIALHDITGDDPIAPDHRGRVTSMVADWVEWGREHGFKR